jgi:hypothetical protein
VLDHRGQRYGTPDGVLIDGRKGGPNLIESAATAAGDFTLTARVRVIDNSGAPSLAFGWRDPDLAFLVPLGSPGAWTALVNGQDDPEALAPVSSQSVELEIARHGSRVEMLINGSRVRVLEGRSDVYKRLRFSAMGDGALMADYVSLN